ncbi:MAG: DUF1549 domain-containing protein, partial [Bacteroidota bacterium]
TLGKSPHYIVTVRRLLSAVFLTLLLVGCGPQLPEDIAAAYEELPQELDFNIHVKPILSDKCFACHGPDQAKIKGGLQLHSEEVAFKPLPASGQFALTPGNLRKSEVFHRIVSEDPAYQMPTPESNLTLSALEKATLIKWIEQGAEYQPHWAFTPPKAHDIPEVPWPTHNPIDHFVFAKLQEQGMSPSREATQELLLRRVSLDLTGLPPTEEEINAFLSDTTEAAYEQQVDRLLDSPHYGEKMAMDWLDLARYADTHGYQVDRYRDMSPWRDWVIESFNENRPYDEFVTWQLAGDLSPNPTREQILATAFNRLHPQNLEGGIVDEEFRVEYVADRTAVLGQGLMAMTLSCARCHDHKFDPISQKDFYELYSFFNNINETGQISWDMATPVPTLMLPTEEQESIIAYLEEQIEEKSEAVEAVQVKEEAAANAWIDAGSYQQLVAQRPQRGLVGHFRLDGTLQNHVPSGQVAKMDRQFSKKEVPNYQAAYRGQGLLLDGDAWLDTKPVGIFKRNQSFSIGLWVHLPKTLDEGVIFHKNQGSRLHSFRGYHLYLRNNRLEVMLAHTWPDNAIIERTTQDVPCDRWIHLMMTYDGSSSAGGLRLYLDGEEQEMEVEIDNLYKDIVFNYLEDQIYEEPIEPGLQIGARWRGKGIGGALIDELMVYDVTLSGPEIRQIVGGSALVKITSKPVEKLSAAERSALRDYYLANYSSNYQ